MLVRIFYLRPNFLAVNINLSVILALQFRAPRDCAVTGHNILYLIIRFFVNGLQILLYRNFLLVKEIVHILIEKVGKLLHFLLCFVLEYFVHCYLFWTVNNR